MHLADNARLNHLHAAPQAVGGAALIAHLRGHFALSRQPAQQARLVHGVGQRFLDKDVFAHLHCR